MLNIIENAQHKEIISDSFGLNDRNMLTSKELSVKYKLTPNRINQIINKNLRFLKIKFKKMPII